MKKYCLLLMLGAWASALGGARAQMSTFPAPPPLASGQNQSSESGSASESSVAPPAPADSAPPARTTAPAPPATVPMTAATLTSMNALDDKVAIEDGDTISFRVIEDRDEPVTRVVTDTGEVDFPYIGRVKVEGQTCHAVAQEVKKLLEVDYYKQATVIVGLDLIVGEDHNKPKDMAWVMGEVREVGPEELLKQQPMTVSQMIMRAGGFGDFADQRRVKIIHRLTDTTGTLNISSAKDFQVIDVKSIFDGKSTADPLVKPGDYIIVPKKIVNFGD